MRVRLTLRSAKGAELVARTVTPRSATAIGGDIGQAAWEMYGEANRAGHDLVGTRLEVDDAPHDDDLVERAQAYVRQKRQRDPRS